MICIILLACLKPTGGFEDSVCRKMWCWLQKGALPCVEGGGGADGMWAVGDSVAPCSTSCGAVWVLRKVRAPDRAASSRSHVLAPPAEWGLGVDRVNLQMIHMNIQMCVCVCVLWSWEASSVPKANLTAVKFTTFSRSWDSALFQTIMSLRALSSGSGQVWFRRDSISGLIRVSVSSLGLPLHGGGYFTPTAAAMCDSRVTDPNVTPADPHVFAAMERRYHKFTVNKEGWF